MILELGNPNNPIFCFMNKKRAERKHFYIKQAYRLFILIGFIANFALFI